MESEDIKEKDITEDEGDGVPVCIKCFEPVDPLDHYCPHCGEISGQFTQYIPFVNLRWQCDVWGKAWRQIWSHDISIPGKLLRFFMIIWYAPILLIGFIFRINSKTKKKQNGELEL